MASMIIKNRKNCNKKIAMMSNIPCGFRFYPTEEELVGFYLRHKLENTRNDIERVVPVVDVYSFEPWQLQQMSGEPSIGDSEQWFFFCPMQEREAQGGRPTRTTASGYWKATGTPVRVFSSSNTVQVIGVKKTMVFYHGRAPHGIKTEWKMNDYKALQLDQDNANSLRLCNDFSLCRIYIKNECLRSFDRRPPPAQECIVERATDVSQHNKSSSDQGPVGEDDVFGPFENIDWGGFLASLT